MQGVDKIPKANAFIIAFVVNILFILGLAIGDYLNWNMKEVTLPMHLILIFLFGIISLYVTFMAIGDNDIPHEA